MSSFQLGRALKGYLRRIFNTPGREPPNPESTAKPVDPSPVSEPRASHVARSANALNATPRLRKALIHRYTNEHDIRAVKANGCSDVFKRSRESGFDLVIVIPTGKARSQIAAVGKAASDQYVVPPDKRAEWLESHKYVWRIDVTDVRYTSLTKVRRALEKRREPFVGAWTVKSAVLDEGDLF